MSYFSWGPELSLTLGVMKYNSFKLRCNFQVYLWFDIVTWFGVHKPELLLEKFSFWSQHNTTNFIPELFNIINQHRWTFTLNWIVVLQQLFKMNRSELHFESQIAIRYEKIPGLGMGIMTITTHWMNNVNKNKNYKD